MGLKLYLIIGKFAGCGTHFPRLWDGEKSCGTF